MIAQKKEWLIVLLLFGVSLFTRNYQLAKKPNGFFCDEASIGLNAYKLLTSGKDEYGKKWPIFFEAFGEYKNPIQIYSTIPIVAIFGPTVESVRLVAGIWGSLGVVICYWLVAKTIDKKTGFLTAVMLMVLPWHWHLSRSAMEGMMAMVSLTFLGIYWWIQKKYYWATACLCLAAYSYFPGRILMPLLGLGLVIMDRKMVDLKKITVWAMALMWPMATHILAGPGMSRWQQVKGEIEPVRMVETYLAHFGFNFLVIKGDAGMKGQDVVRHSVLGLGQLYWWQMLLVAVGLIWGKKIDKKIWAISVLILLLYPLGSAVTEVGTPQATRSILGIVPLTLLMGLGIKNINKSKLIFALMLAITMVSAIDFWQKYDQYEVSGSKYMGWQSGMEESLKYLATRQKDFDQVSISHRFNQAGTMVEFFKLSLDCPKCQTAENPIRVEPDKRQLMALRPEDVAELEDLEPNYWFKVEKTIEYGDGETAFLIGSPVKFETDFER